ncbi:hypothetical protein M8542_49410 [Amycolatopsis sp. OK19-0408]|uniref:Uncharacterized protein n=1 Tax=Amycolatopsis iheyensis TaxID=2945988 RepID=A0A9X2NLB8_9PSEU|nr:hypothetical protein [Amycolatopsis iheyensis]MCR6490829.1 hypothetical protein [Amycolatopsis iheyensis]
MPDRIEISHRSKPIPCAMCGQHALHIGRILSPDGTLLGRTLVCTVCRPRPQIAAFRRAA